MSREHLVFPQEVGASYAMNGQVIDRGVIAGGLTKRELLAALALQGLIQSWSLEHSVSEIAATAAQYADALLAELAKKPEGA